MSRVLRLLVPNRRHPERLASPRRSVFLGSVRSLSEAGHLAASSMPRVRQDSEAVDVNHGKVFYPSLERRRGRDGLARTRPSRSVGPPLCRREPFPTPSMSPRPSSKRDRAVSRFSSRTTANRAGSGYGADNGSSCDSRHPHAVLLPTLLRSRPTRSMTSTLTPARRPTWPGRPSRCDRSARGCDRPDHERAAAGVIGLPGHAWTGGTLNMNWFCGDSFRCPRVGE